MKYRGKDIKTYLRRECRVQGDVVILGLRSCDSTVFSKTEFLSDFYSKLQNVSVSYGIGSSIDESNLVYATSQKRKQCISMAKDQLVNDVIDNYSVARKNITGYKVMYHKGTTVIDGEEANIFFPVLVYVEIPKNSLIYEDPNEAKCRATKGKIKEILDANLMRSRHVKIMVTRGRNRWFIRAQIFDQLDDENYILSIEPSWMEILSGSFGRYFRHDEMKGIYKVRNVRNDVVYSMFEAQNFYNYICTYSTKYSTVIPYHFEDLERHEGDVIDESDNFDMRPVTCSSGFHFFKEPTTAVSYVSI